MDQRTYYVTITVISYYTVEVQADSTEEAHTKASQITANEVVNLADLDSHEVEDVGKPFLPDPDEEEPRDWPDDNPGFDPMFLM